MSYSYKPRRCGKRWLEGAPPYILSVHYAPKFADCYTFFYWETDREPETCPRDAEQPYLATSHGVEDVFGFSQSGSIPPGVQRRYSGKHIKWLDVPKNVRKHVIRRLEEPHE